MLLFNSTPIKLRIQNNKLLYYISSPFTKHNVCCCTRLISRLSEEHHGSYVWHWRYELHYTGTKSDTNVKFSTRCGNVRSYPARQGIQHHGPLLRIVQHGCKRGEPPPNIQRASRPADECA